MGSLVRIRVRNPVETCSINLEQIATRYRYNTPTYTKSFRGFMNESIKDIVQTISNN